MHSRNSKAKRDRPIVLFTGAAVLLTGLTATLVSSVNQVMPEVGDMVTFSPGNRLGEETGIRVAVHRPAESDCLLDLDTMRQTGGSLVVEARVLRPVPGFHLHWAGERTSSARDDCGRSADLVVGYGDLGIIATAAGGFGPGFQRYSIIASAMAN